MSLHLEEDPITRGRRTIDEVSKEYDSWMKNKQWGFASRMIVNLIVTLARVMAHIDDLERKEKESGE